MPIHRLPGRTDVEGGKDRTNASAEGGVRVREVEKTSGPYHERGEAMKYFLSSRKRR